MGFILVGGSYEFNVMHFCNICRLLSIDGHFFSLLVIHLLLMNYYLSSVKKREKKIEQKRGWGVLLLDNLDITQLFHCVMVL